MYTRIDNRREKTMMEKTKVIGLSYRVQRLRLKLAEAYACGDADAAFRLSRQIDEFQMDTILRQTPVYQKDA